MTVRITTAEQVVPDGYLTPACRAGLRRPDWEFGHCTCEAPGYQHPVLGWMDVPCVCACHTPTEEQT